MARRKLTSQSKKGWFTVSVARQDTCTAVSEFIVIELHDEPGRLVASRRLPITVHPRMIEIAKQTLARSQEAREAGLEHFQDNEVIL